MLVLSRRQDENIVFPNLGIRICVVRVAGKVVRLGIDAPADVRVLREELADADFAADRGSPPDNSACLLAMRKEARHALRNCLNTATLGLHVLQRRIDQGDTLGLDGLILQILDELHAIDSQLEEQKKAEQAQSGGPRHRALIVEDNANESRLLAEYLQMSGYEVHVVENGLQAIDYLQQNELPDVVLLDMNMPQMSGPETIACIRDEPSLRSLKLFGVSGLEQREAGIETGPHGVDRWFTKPVDAQSLVRHLDRELASKLTSA